MSKWTNTVWIFCVTVKDYCLANNEKSRINLKTPKRESKQRTKRNADGDNTYTITLKMFRGGATIEEIAEEREIYRRTRSKRISSDLFRRAK